MKEQFRDTDVAKKDVRQMDFNNYNLNTELYMHTTQRPSAVRAVLS